jgi:hypothetical protein
MYTTCQEKILNKSHFSTRDFSRALPAHYRPYFPQLESYSRLTAEKAADSPRIG